MSPIIASVIRRSLSWLATRGKGVSKHISHHTRSAANAAARNPRYVARTLGRTPHSIFADSRPRKLVQKTLEKYDNAIVQRNGHVLVEKHFNRVIGKANEQIIRVIIDSRTGRIITAFPVTAFATVSTALAATTDRGNVIVSGTFDEILVETIEGVEKLATDWERKKPKPRTDVWTFVIDLLLDPAPAGDPDEVLHVQVHHYVKHQSFRVIEALEKELGRCLSQGHRLGVQKQFLDAVAGAGIDTDDEW